MKHKAHAEGRDLLLVDCGDLHDGTGLSDTTPIDGEITDEIFKYLDYDLLSVGYIPCLIDSANEETMSCMSELSQNKCMRNLCLDILDDI